MDLGLRDAHVVINGGSKGMGRAAALRFAEDGAKVAILARTQSVLDETVEALTAAGSPDAVGISTDLTSDDSVRAAFEQLGERWGHLNTLVNAAGPVEVGVSNFDDTTDQQWLDTFSIGTLSAVRCVRWALPMLRRAEWARIVNVSAHSTKRQAAEIVPYTAAKAALTSVSKNLSLSLAKENILVNTVSPGSFLSPGMVEYLARQPAERNIDPTSLTDAMRVMIEDFDAAAHLPRAGDPSEIGPMIAFVGSRVNTYMTGANINVDGGSDFC